MKKILFAILVFFVMSSAAVAAYKQDTIASRLIQYSNFEVIQQGIYVSPETTATQRQELIGLVEEAKSRITAMFGEYTASPVIISTHVPSIRKKYSDNSYAKALLLPLSSNKAYIVIGEDGHNVDVVSHELMHAEVFNRLGYLNLFTEIPVWFNEGVSMQVDFRDRYNDPSSDRKLEELEKRSQFYKGSSKELTQHYSLSKAEVNSWLWNKNKHFLYQFLEEISKGGNFKKLYSSYHSKS